MRGEGTGGRGGYGAGGEGGLALWPTTLHAQKNLLIAVSQLRQNLVHRYKTGSCHSVILGWTTVVLRSIGHDIACGELGPHAAMAAAHAGPQQVHSNAASRENQSLNLYVLYFILRMGRTETEALHNRKTRKTPDPSHQLGCRRRHRHRGELLHEGPSLHQRLLKLLKVDLPLAPLVHLSLTSDRPQISINHYAGYEQCELLIYTVA